MEMYITKYALTRGIIKVDNAEKCSADNLVSVGLYHSYFRYLQDIFPDLLSAQKDAEQRRIKKIKSLKNQLNKLESMTIKLREGL